MNHCQYSRIIIRHGQKRIHCFCPTAAEKEKKTVHSNCEAELEDLSGHEREQQTRRQLLISGPDERQSEQAMLLSICEAELEEVYGHEREQQIRRQLLIPSPLQTNDSEQ